MAGSSEKCAKSIHTAAPLEKANSGAEKSRQKFGCLIAFAIGGVVLAILMMIGSMSDKSPSRSSSTELSDANAVCVAMRSTDIALRCSVVADRNTINLIVNMTAIEARKMCSGVREEIRPYTSKLGNWVLRIYSPLDTSNHIASCSL